ncbi:MAG: TIGR04255 family protein [Raineya sp.]|jgi:uncharacterized protein (TIGR04255 family)|nr:TIGR04255 family protein [Raineya sp.]
MEFKNHKIKEVVCLFRFDTSLETSWNVGKFADFYKEIEKFGFTKTEERRPVQVKFNISNDPKDFSSETIQNDLQIIYRTEEDYDAIIMSKDSLSVHALNKYDGWDTFFPKIEKYLGIYFDLNLGRRLIDVQVMYINEFSIDIEEKLVDYLKFVPDMSSFSKGREINHVFNSDFFINDTIRVLINTICQTKTSAPPKKMVTVQINCTGTYPDDAADWQTLANNVHVNAVEVFKTVITENFKNKLR